MSEEKTRSRISASRVKWLLGEIPGWVDEGLVSREAADTLAGRYLDAAAASGRAKLVYVIGIFAAVLLGTGVILFFASNWDAISRFGKLVIICFAVAGAYFAGYELKYVLGYGIIGEAVILLGAILFGAGIYLTAQAFHISAEFPNGTLLWMLGLVPLCVLTRSKPMLALITVLFSVWIIWEIASANRLDYSPVVVKSIAGFFILGGIVYMVYSFGGKANAALMVPAAPVLLTVFQTSLLGKTAGYSEGYVFLSILSFFMALGVLGALHRYREKWPPFGNLYQFMAMLAASGMIYVLTFGDASEEMIEGIFSVVPAIIGIIFLLAAVFNSAKILGKALDGGETSRVADVYIYLGLSAFVFLMYFVFRMPHSEGLISFISNIVLFGFAISLIFAGYRGGFPRLINLGIFVFGVDVITRYFDLFWDIMPRSLFFMAGGAILLAGGIWLEKSRKKWIMEAKGGES